MPIRFEDRCEAGRRLAGRLRDLLGGQAGDAVVLGLPRGGVPVAAEVARALAAPLDVLMVRKVGAPGQPEVGVGAIADGDPPLFDDGTLEFLGLTPGRLAADVERERAELRRRERVYRRYPPVRLSDRTVVLVDDGLATGVTARAALRHLRAQRPGRLVLAVPVGAAQAVADLRREADDLVCVHQPQPFRAVGCWYQDFHQVSDQEVIGVLREFHAESV